MKAQQLVGNTPPPQCEADFERLDAVAAQLERSASWFPPPDEGAPASEPARASEPAPASEPTSVSTPAATTAGASAARTETRSAPSKPATKPAARPLGKKERRAVAAERAAQQRRERRRQSEQQRQSTQATQAQPAPVARTSERSHGVRAPRPKRHVPWISIAILLVPIGVILRADRLGKPHDSGRAIVFVLLALVLAWLLRKR